MPGSTMVMLLFINFLAPLNNLFKFSPLKLADFDIAFILGLASIAWYKIYKLIGLKTNKPS